MVLCVTGPMAAGKNAASSILEKMGFVSIDADLIGHDAVENCKEKILEEFSSLAQKNKIHLLSQDGKINRKNLGQLIFKDKALVKKQEDIVFPYINSVLENFIDENSKK
ncbi:MAG TPA: dephospho-CoA kinase, partial [Treponema sp.]|nr:dephospho-CoA kinase [Treponema sp.]